MGVWQNILRRAARDGHIRQKQYLENPYIHVRFKDNNRMHSILMLRRQMSPVGISLVLLTHYGGPTSLWS